MFRKKILFLFLCLALFASACSGEPTPEVTKAEQEPTQVATPQLGPNCNPILDHVKAMSGASGEEQTAVPVAPNASLVKGSILCLQQLRSSQLKIQPEKKIYAAVIAVAEAGDVPGQTNRLAGHELEKILVFAEAPFVYDKTTLETQVVVTYRADEAGGAYWVVGDQFSMAPFENTLTVAIEYN